MPHNIDYAAPGRAHQYVGYGVRGQVYRIHRQDGGGWRAVETSGGRDVGAPYLYARTLADLGAKLERA